MKKAKFYQIISDIVDKIAQEKNLTRTDLAILLNFSESYIKQIHSPSSKKHYSTFSLYLLAKEWNISTDCLFPSKENLKNLKQFYEMSDTYIEKYIKAAEKELREEI